MIILTGRDIICISSAMWDGLWVNSQHVMSRLSKSNRVMYVESTGLRPPAINRTDLRKVLCRIAKIIKGPRQINDNLIVVPPIVLPFSKISIINRLNSFSLRFQMMYLSKKYKFQDPILWIFLPTGHSLIGHLNEKLVVYHCVDDYSANPGVSRGVIKKMDAELLAKANIVLVTSPTLFKKAKRKNPNTYFLPNVADVEFFSTAQEQLAIPDDIQALHHPIIGYIGNISSYKINLEILVYVSKQHHEWSIVLIGPVGYGDPLTDISNLNCMSNVYLLGQRPYEELPAYLKRFDVCIIPFHENRSTLSSFPLKFHEYLAAGKKVVCTPLPAFEPYADVVYYARTPEEYNTQIEQALANEITPGQWVRREEIKEANSWKRRIEEISEIIVRNLPKNQTRL